MGKFQEFLTKNQKRLPSEVIEKTFDHLIRDAARRKEKDIRVVEEKKLEEIKEKLEPKKLTSTESNKIYDKHLQRLKTRDENIKQKRREKEYKEEIQVLDFKAIRKKKHLNGSSLQHLSRMEADVKMRKAKDLAIQREKEKQEALEVFLFNNPTLA